MSANSPRGTRSSFLSLNCQVATDPMLASMLGTHLVSRAVQEALHAVGQLLVAEQRLAEAGQQQVLHVQGAGDALGHLPQQAPRNDGGGLGHLADLAGDVARRLAVPDDHHVLVAGVVQRVELAGGDELAAGADEVGVALVLREDRVGEDAVRDHQVVEPLGRGDRRADPPCGDHPAVLGVGQLGADHLGGEPQVRAQLELRDIALEVGLDLLAGGPLGVVPGHRQVREGVRILVVLCPEARVPAGRAPDPADVRRLLEDGDVVLELAEDLRGGQSCETGTDDGDLQEAPALSRFLAFFSNRSGVGPCAIGADRGECPGRLTFRCRLRRLDRSDVSGSVHDCVCERDDRHPGTQKKPRATRPPHSAGGPSSWPGSRRIGAHTSRLTRPCRRTPSTTRGCASCRQLEAAHPALVTPESPTQSVGGAAAAGIRHGRAHRAHAVARQRLQHRRAGGVGGEGQP